MEGDGTLEKYRMAGAMWLLVQILCVSVQWCERT